MPELPPPKISNDDIDEDEEIFNSIISQSSQQEDEVEYELNSRRWTKRQRRELNMKRRYKLTKSIGLGTLWWLHVSFINLNLLL